MNESIPSRTHPPQAAKKPRRWLEVRGTRIIRQQTLGFRNRITWFSQSARIELLESIDRLFACIFCTIRQTVAVGLAARKELQTDSPGKERFRPRSRLAVK